MPFTEKPLHSLAFNGWYRPKKHGGPKVSQELTVEIVDRYCEHCGAHYRATKKSPVRFCSWTCRKENEEGIKAVKCSRRRNVAKGKERVSVSVTPPTQNTELENLLSGPSVERAETLKGTESMRGEATTNTAKKETKPAPQMREQIENARTPTLVPATLPTEKSLEQRSTQAEGEGIQSTDSSVSSSTLETAVLDSMNSCRDTAQHLFKLMNDLNANRPDATVTAANPERVQSAIEIGKTICVLMKERMNGAKIISEIKKEHK